MSYSKIKFLLHILGSLLILLNFSQAREASIRIPVTINPIVQLPFEELSKWTKTLYEMDKDFYSKVTVADVARTEDEDITETIKKSIEVAFLIAASSKVSGTLKRNKLERSSKWSYKIPVKKILSEANGSFTKLTDKIQIYKIQELAMKILARRYGFSIESILQKHHMKLMEFYAANEEQWIKIVGTITNIIIKNNSDELNLTPCYLAELINKTQEEMKGFTLQEVDMYLKNMSKLKEKLPAYQNATLRSFYQAFNMTPQQLAEMSNIKTPVIKAMGVKDTIRLFTRTILLKFNFTKVVLPSAIVGPEEETICRGQWTLFRDIIVTESFEKEAKEISISPSTLGALIGLPNNDAKRLSLIKMLHLIEIVISPLKEDKRMIEKFPLSMLENTFSPRRFNTKKHNAISFIKRTTKLSKRKLKVIYGWTSRDYHFARLFSVKDLGDECSFNISRKTLFLLAKINLGKASAEEPHCKAFFALKLVWGQASLTDLKKLYYPNTRISLGKPIAVLVSKLTNSSIKMSCRVLSKTPIIQWLLKNISLNNLTEMTNHTDIYLQEIPIQRIMLMIYQLYSAGSFDSVIQVHSKALDYSTYAEENFTEEVLTDVWHNGDRKPTANPQSLSKHHLPDTALLVSLLVTAFLIPWTAS